MPHFQSSPTAVKVSVSWPPWRRDEVADRRGGPRVGAVVAGVAVVLVPVPRLAVAGAALARRRPHAEVPLTGHLADVGRPGAVEVTDRRARTATSRRSTWGSRRRGWPVLPSKPISAPESAGWRMSGMPSPVTSAIAGAAKKPAPGCSGCTARGWRRCGVPAAHAVVDADAEARGLGDAEQHVGRRRAGLEHLWRGVAGEHLAEAAEVVNGTSVQLAERRRHAARRRARVGRRLRGWSPARTAWSRPLRS